MSYKLLTPVEVIARIEKFCDKHETFQDAAEAMGCSPSQLSTARSGSTRPCDSILEAIGVQCISVFATDDFPKTLHANGKAR